MVMQIMNDDGFEISDIFIIWIENGHTKNVNYIKSLYFFSSNWRY